MNKRDREQILKGLDDPCRGLVVAHKRLRNHSFTHEYAEEANRIMYLIDHTFLISRDIRRRLERLMESDL